MDRTSLGRHTKACANHEAPGGLTWGMGHGEDLIVTICPFPSLKFCATCALPSQHKMENMREREREHHVKIGEMPC